MQCQACSLSAVAHAEEVDDEEDDDDDVDTTFEFGIDGYATWLAGRAPKDPAKIVSYALKHATTLEQKQHACRVLVR